MWLDIASSNLGWPPPEEITNPKGGGPRHYARLIDQKIGSTLARNFGLRELTTGILTADPSADTAESPLAVVLQFSETVKDAVLREAHRLCWNFSRTAILVTLEPTRIQTWTCNLAPKKTRRLDHLRVLPAIDVTEGESPTSVLQSDVAQALHWVNLVTGAILHQHASKFKKDERADALLVSNLRAVRKRLRTMKLDRNICHALLARLIFTQFLFQRTDAEGRPAISQSMLDQRFDGHLTRSYSHDKALEQILQDKEETYALFRWLNEKFNGDLFPGKGASPAAREVEWRVEKDAVTPDHLSLLAEFVSGRLTLESGQRSFWPLYSFDTLPLEFISSVYEEFLNEDQQQLGAYYTPPHLVDFVLDGVLSWGGTEWDLRILDPCCGSGIFLVKAFQRLVQRWKNAHPDEEPRLDELRYLLENNLFGVDESEDAIRVASFSLCLALCDLISPKYYWKRALFPRLRDRRLVKSDFFAEDRPGFRTKGAGEERAWDLVVGNAPWRGGALAEDSLGTRWAVDHGWPVADRNPGPLFLAKAAALVKTGGWVSMIQPAATLLYQRSWEPSNQLRRKLFSTHAIEEVVSFAHLRWQLFKGAKSPVCLVTLRVVEPKSDAVFTYICPKPLFTSEDAAAISIERQDTHTVTAQEAIDDPVVWTILLLGQRRDVTLIRRLRRQATLRKLKAKKRGKAKEGQVLLTREGIIRGSTNQRDEPAIVDRKMLEKANFPEFESLLLDADALPTNRDPRVDHAASTDFGAFEMPQLVVKKSILKKVGRLQAQLVRAKRDRHGIICSHSYMSIHQFTDGDGWLRSACLTLRSRLSAYFLALTSRLAFDRGEALSGHILDIPIPKPDHSLLAGDIALTEVDDLVEDAFGLKKPERALISDLLEFGYREGASGSGVRPGREATVRSDSNESDDLYQYAEFFVNTLLATFGHERAVCATIFEEVRSGERLPVRMIAVHLDWRYRHPLVMKERLESRQLRHRLSKCYDEQLGVRTRHGTSITSGLGFRRVARVFLTHQAPDGTQVPTVLFVKPDQRRYWSRSQGLRDADELAAAIMTSGKRQH